MVHDVIAEAFLGPCPEGMEVRHSNGDLLDNRASNLAYVPCGTGSRLLARSSKARGERINTAKPTENEVRKIRLAYARGGVSQQELAAQFGVSQAEIGYIVLRKAWTHI
jgi:hypothetical protein